MDHFPSPTCLLHLQRPLHGITKCSVVRCHKCEGVHLQIVTTRDNQRLLLLIQPLAAFAPINGFTGYLSPGAPTSWIGRCAPCQRDLLTTIAKFDLRNLDRFESCSTPTLGHSEFEFDLRRNYAVHAH